MQFQEIIARQAIWATRNVAYNLDFIPDDKLNWKPAPKANSALEVIQHMLGAFGGLSAFISGEAKPDSFQMPDIPVPTSRDDAKAKIIEAGDKYAALARSIPDADLARVVDLRMFSAPMARVLQMPALDAIHHHGQIAYIQLLLGDEESHFDFAVFEQM